MFNSDPYLKQARQNIRSLIAERKFQTAYTKCKEMISRYPDEEIFKDLRGEIEEAVEEENSRVIRDKIKLLEPLWGEEKYDQILRELKPLFELSKENRYLIETYEKAQKLYLKQISKSQKKFQKEQHKRLEIMLDENPAGLLEQIKEIERNNPNNGKMLEFTGEFRRRLVEKRIKENKELLNSDKYSAIQNLLHTLQLICKDCPELFELEKKLEKNIQIQQIDQKKEFIFHAENSLRDLYQLKKYEKAVFVAEEILALDPDNKTAKKIKKLAEEKLCNETREATIEIIKNSLPKLKEEYKKDRSSFVRF